MNQSNWEKTRIDLLRIVNPFDEPSTESFPVGVLSGANVGRTEVGKTLRTIPQYILIAFTSQVNPVW